jgi:phosphatidylserine/phosphatidylglycerophosphate/cardiolipin synthase-like enzyme
VVVAAATLGSSRVWAHFTDPLASGGSDPTILREFERLIDAAPAGSAIKCAIHSITRVEPADALVRARDRGVEVQVVVDGNVAASTRAGAVRLRDLGADVRFCTGNSGGGCVTSNVGNMHVKLLTLSATSDPDGAVRRSVCWFGSPNLTATTGMARFNDTVTVYDDTTLHTGFGRYFRALWDARSYPGNDFYDAAARRGYYRGATATVFASPAQRLDLVRSRLNDLKPASSCRIRVAQAQFTDGRRGLADLLVAHKRRGCGVWVAVGFDADGGANIGPTALRTLKNAGIPVRKQLIHSKFVLVAGNFSGEFRRRVYTGSHNWTYSANYDNDEIFVRMLAETGDRHPLYDAYRAHFAAAYDTGAPV